MITSNAAGKVHVNTDEMATRHWAWGGAVVGIMFPPSIIAAGQAVLVIVGKSKLQQVADKAGLTAETHVAKRPASPTTATMEDT